MYTITRESFDSLAVIRETGTGLQWSSIFVLPTWMQVWWQQFHTVPEPYLLSVRDDKQVIGIAPLQIVDGVASLVGGDNVCDYLDFVVQPGFEEPFFNTVLDDQKAKGVRQLRLGLVRPDSIVITKLVDLARRRGFQTNVNQEDVTSEMPLAATFEEYLNTLNTKQRHEVRRKLRRLSEAGKIEYNCTGNVGWEQELETFLHLFSLARDEKARFMTPDMEIFFRALSKATASIGIFRLGKLEIDSKPAAMTMCFDHNDTTYLYNSGFDPQYDSLSVGLMSKVLGIQECIRQGRKKFEFLKGNEIYKERLGGKEIPLYRCIIELV